MTFKQNFVMVVKANGRILREIDGIVTLPFLTEYSLYLKNLESRRVAVKIHIDSKYLGRDLIIEPNDFIEVERFIENLDYGHRFRFIQKTEEIAQNRGDFVEDGTIRCEFRYQKAVPIVTYSYHHEYHYNHPTYWPYIWYNSPSYPCTYGLTSSGAGGGGSYSASSTLGSPTAGASINSCSIGEPVRNIIKEAINPLPSEGITVNGEISNQQFHTGYIGELEENSSVIVIQLRGTTDRGPVKKPVTVRDKLVCPICGRKNDSINRCCYNCGTNLL